MLEFFFALLANVVLVSIPIGALWILGVVKVSAKWALGSLALLAAYFVALFLGRAVIPVELIISEPGWNWGGKILAILLWICVLILLVRFSRGFKPSDAGFTLKQIPGSVKPAIVGLVAAVLLQVLWVYLNGGNEYDAEELLFQALMPGADEEPVFRGVLLYLVSRAVISERFSVLGARFNVAGLAVAAVFGLAHSLSFHDHTWHFSFTTLLVTGLYGVIFLWFRERTGSLVFPVVAHNTVNFVGQLI
ncbi:MAG: CPBP family intramembrane metalloprotease [Acidobacteria bacterium]|nr:MAG: CPBP family intramembrane metalloprotease [Acidobacteriota bacterium]